MQHFTAIRPVNRVIFSIPLGFCQYSYINYRDTEKRYQFSIVFIINLIFFVISISVLSSYLKYVSLCFNGKKIFVRIDNK